MKAKRIGIAIVITLISLTAVFGVAFFLLTNPAIKINGWEELDLKKLERIHQTATITDIDGNVIAENIYSQNRIYTPLQTIPQYTKDAFISVEDKRYYTHHGVDYIRMLGALKNNLVAASLKEGASTITQQLVKNTHLSNEKTFLRKIKEIRIAKQLEKEYSKDEILEAYLNILYFGNNVYGIGQASNTYFNKNVEDLTIAESAMLAGMINNPAKYNPLTHFELAERRKNIVLERMESNGKIDKTSLATEQKTPVTIKQADENPYLSYIENIITEAATALDCLPEEVFEYKPKIIASTKKGVFDNIFRSMSDIVYDNKYSIRALVVDNRSSEVLYDTSNITSTPNIKRQPGSTIKPFISYAPAFERKLVYPISMISDEQTDFDGYTPDNFRNKYYGNVTIADSLKLSLNVPAVKLVDMCGLSYAKSIASKFGIAFSPKDKGLAVALGGLTDGVTLNTLADAYGTLARMGIYSQSRYVNSIFADGKEIYRNKSTSKKIVGSDTAYLLTDMLMGCAQSGTAKKLHEFTNVAAKTGTVERGQKNSDAYCIAYTPNYTVAVWYGNDGESKDIYGGEQPALIAKRILSALNDKEKFEVPSDVVELDVDEKKLIEDGSVYLAPSSTPPRYRKKYYFSRNNMPNQFYYRDLPTIFEDEFISDDWYNFEIIDSFGN